MRWSLVLVLFFLGCNSDGSDDPSTDAGAGGADGGSQVDASLARAGTIYLNFAGVTVQPGLLDDASQNISRLIDTETSIAAFDASAFTNTASQQQFITAIADQIAIFYADFDVAVVTERPSSGDYVMAILGGSPEDVGLRACTDQDLSCSLGTAWLDCAPFPETAPGELVYNLDGDSAIAFIFTEVFTRFPERSFEESVLRIAATSAHEIGHTFGLAHVTGQDCVMNANSTGTTSAFCVSPYQAGDGHCGPGTEQDAPAILSELFASP